MIREPQLDLPRPTPAADRGPLDDDLYDLVERRFRRLLTTNPPFATHLGVHDLDDVLGRRLLQGDGRAATPLGA